MNWIGYCLLGGIWVCLVMIYVKLTDVDIKVDAFRRRFEKIIDTVIEALNNKKNKED